MVYVLDFDIVAFILSAITLILYSIQKQISTRQNILFMFILICSVISSLAGFISSILMNALPDSNQILTMLVTIAFFLNHNSLPICVFSYVLALTGKYPKKFWIRSLLSIPYFISFILIVTTPFTHFLFYFSEGVYCKNWGIYYLYGSAFLYLLGVFFLFLSKKVRITPAVRNSIYICLLIPSIAIVIQINNPSITLESFAGSVCFLFIFMGIQNKKYSIDPQTKFYTSEVFNFLINERIEKENKFYVIFIRSPDISVLQELFDYKRYSLLLSMISLKVQGICEQSFEIFSIEEGLYAIIPKKNLPKSSIGNTAIELVNQLEKVWTIETAQIELTIQVTILQYPIDFLSYQEVTERIEILTRFPRRTGNRHIFYGKDLHASDIRYRADITTQLHEIFRVSSLDLRYQPIYNCETKSFIALEVSLFIKNHENRQIRQHDIFKTAHDIGLSAALNTLMFKQALWWFVKARLPSYGISKIELKLQEAQCIDSSWARNILNLCSECSFEPKYLCLLISESILSFNKSSIYANIDLLKNAGVNFAIDGFGTAYTNMEMIIKSPINSIKLDKELIHESTLSIKGKQLLKGTLSMFNKLSFNVIAEGIETQEQYDSLTQAGCTYLQGYHLSYPLSGDDIVALLKKQ